MNMMEDVFDLPVVKVKETRVGDSYLKITNKVDDFVPFRFTEIWEKDKTARNTYFKIVVPTDVWLHLVKGFRERLGIYNEGFDWQQFKEFRGTLDIKTGNIYHIVRSKLLDEYRSVVPRNCKCSIKNKAIGGWKNVTNKCLWCTPREENQRLLKEVRLQIKERIEKIKLQSNAG